MTDELTIPDKPEVETHEHIPQQVGDDIRFEFRAVPDRGGRIEWTAEWDGRERTGYTDEFSEQHGAIIYPRSPKIGGEPTKGSKLDDDLLATLQDDLAAMQEFAEAKREAERQAKRNEELTLTVEEVTYETGHRTKYTHESRVLVPSKRSTYWTDEEADVVDALKSELDEADDKPLAEGEDNPLADVDEGEEFALAELAEVVDGLEDAVDEIVDDREREQARAALREEHPELYGVSFDPDDVEAAFDEAADAGEPVPVATGISECVDDNRECSLDRVTYRATPDGKIDTRRVHTY
jgi:hypothetical protein